MVFAELVCSPETFKRLPSQEQKELLRLLIREIRVNHFDPEKDVLPDGRPAFVGEIQKPCFLVKVSFYANALLSGACGNSRKSLYFSLNGWASRDEAHETVEATFVMGMCPLQCKISPFILYPFESEHVDSLKAERSSEPVRHQIHRVMAWGRWLAEDAGRTFLQVAQKERLSRARVTQMMKLLKLSREIQNDLRGLDNPAEIRFFSIRKLLKIAAMHPRKQSSEFAQLRAEFLSGGCGSSFP